MNDLILYFAVAVVGGIFGRRIKTTFTWMAFIQNFFMLMLIISLGVKIGINEDVMKNLGHLGVYAFIFTITVMLGRVLSVMGLRVLFKVGRFGLKNENPSGKKRYTEAGQADRTKLISLMILLSLGLGIAVGHFFEQPCFDSLMSILIKVGLCVLLFFVGMSFGVEGNLRESLIAAGPYSLIIVFGTIVGTFVGSLLMSLVLPVSIKESLAVGAGFGWYSLAPGILIDNGYIIAGTISFMHNIMREVIGILMIPIVADKIGYAECVSLPGSSAMDVCLPIIERSSNGETALSSFFSGGILSIAMLREEHFHCIFPAFMNTLRNTSC